MIQRPEYIERLMRWKDRSVIKVVTGVRRCGKSTLLKLFQEHLLATGVESASIISYNLEQMELEDLRDPRRLHDEILARTSALDNAYVFLDEVQQVEEFQRVVDSLYTRGNIDLYITGSNALLLGGTLATLLSGRYVEINVLPLSFAEYVSASDNTASVQRLYQRYLANGSLPATLAFADDQTALHDYLSGILNTVLLKDVLQRLNASNSIALEHLVTYMFDNIGNPTSIKGIADAITAGGTKISPNTVESYLSALCDAFIFYRARRFDLRGKRILRQQEKYYAVDTGMRRTMLSGSVRDTGRLLENVVYLELCRRYGDVYIGKIDSAEIDFVTNDATGLHYYQVAKTVQDKRTLERELAPLHALRDNYAKMLITLDDADPIDHEGIMQVNALDWLTESAAF